MITKEHKKHSHLSKPPYGNYCRNEWAIVGTQCTTIQALADEIITALSVQYKCAYADAQHPPYNTEGTVSQQLINKGMVEYTNRQYDHQFNYRKDLNRFEHRAMFNDVDFMLLNGNHFEAQAQVVVIDKSKETSLQKRVSQLNNIELILLANDDIEVFDFIKEVLPAGVHIPIYKCNETSKIIAFFSEKMAGAKPPVNGLVLAGGKSERMGYDKGSIVWHGKEQRYYVADLLKNVCTEVYVSLRSDQQKEANSGYQTLTDTFTGIGPYGAILSAFRENPGVAWLVVACDLPLLDLNTLKFLHDHRNPSSVATAFESEYNKLPEPLITIWEPKSYPILLSFLSQGYSCPGKMLQNSDTTILKVPFAESLTNVNTVEELENVRLVLKNKPGVEHAS